ncbi:carboxymuconolactone decarboxylase family protein [Clostridium puniceum]|uniref:Carboxymuconolactone decarboxylase family protein n=1 Tax=Clostridium puniceum TaxID=29367 RepID=A0A1S8T6Y0_9CLOT|nr:carboxymuconolactone decarboxylase family protein [Clostridium puniceum]OOM73384.1 carboxymuconolactone decarboxylase family protein [Clostridium puniceum]
MKTNRYQKGVNKLMDFTYGDIYTCSGLDNKQRSLVTISSLVTQGTLPQLEYWFNSMLDTEEIIKTFIQLLSYIGFPRLLNAIEVAKKVFSQRGITVKIPKIKFIYLKLRLD